MERILNIIMANLELLTINGKDAERLVHIKSLVRELLSALHKAVPEEGNT